MEEMVQIKICTASLTLFACTRCRTKAHPEAKIPQVNFDFGDLYMSLSSDLNQLDEKDARYDALSTL